MKTAIKTTTLFQRKRICKLFHERQMTRQEIADKFGITTYGVRNILSCHMNEDGEYIQRPEKSLPKSPLTKIKNEVWRELEISTRGRYIISDHGRIKSFVKDKFNGEVLRGKLHSGYLSFDYFNTDLKWRTSILIHVLVAQTFLEKPKDFNKVKYYIIHKNHNRFDNRASNLKFVNSQEWRDRIRYNPNPRRLSYLLMNRETVAQLKKELYRGKSKIKDLAVKYNISKMQVARIARGDSWPDILPHLTRDRVETNYTPEKTKKAILKHLEAGKLRQKAIAEKYGVSETVVHRLKKSITNNNEYHPRSNMIC